jgi:TM2 domain-containing membrane protein YozV
MREEHGVDCINHSGTNATAYCQNCGKPLCQTCVRQSPGGQIFCEPCNAAWQSAQHPFYSGQPGAPSPQLAAVLGVIPGVGAMYNGQFLKGLVHVLIFAVLVSASHVFHGFGVLVFGWICYQVFEAYHTAKARRDGEPLPDPLGLNEVNSWFGAPPRPQGWTSTGTSAATHVADTAKAAQPSGQPSPESAFKTAPDSQAQWQTPYQGPWSGAGAPGAPPASSGSGFSPIPPIPPPSHLHWRREPIGAVILIVLGVLFLLDRFDWFSGRVFEFSWPIALIGLGLWLIVRRVTDVRGGQR